MAEKVNLNRTCSIIRKGEVLWESLDTWSIPRIGEKVALAKWDNVYIVTDVMTTFGKSHDCQHVLVYVKGENSQLMSIENKLALALCPCGKQPKELSLEDNGQGRKWATASGDCCSEWQIEFKTEYNDLDTAVCMDLAVKAWNDTPRARDLAN